MIKVSGFNWRKIRKNIWWFILLLIGAYYIYVNYARIIGSPDSIDIIIVLVVILLVFMPLTSEVNVFGMSIKKQIEDTKREIKNDISGLRLEFMQHNISNSQNNDIRIDIGDKYLPSKENIKKDIEEETKDKSFIEKEDINFRDSFENISDNQVLLFKSRYTIENKFSILSNVLNIVGNISSYKITEILYKLELIDLTTLNYIKKVYSICSRGIHGEIIDDEYIKYVKTMLPKIIDALDNAIKNASENRICICTRCGYKGAAQYDNVCPVCDFVTDDY